uniref:Transmembrane protein (Modular protein) n=1 Tax=Ralstonia solanacearum TaxID=305 RepID=A0A0S4VTL3_RALSL|nr:Putative transmembrane protein (modular protein) [Ralstonia solanacearum]CUV37916.1 Putative transmembrane protein (modular protein) [Ralstonia solanacearum]
MTHPSSCPHQPIMHRDATAIGADPSNLNQVHRALVLTALFVGLMLWRSPDLLIHPRLWAEEGRFYYDALQNGAAPLTLVIRGNYQLITNLICYTATLVPAEWAAHVTTYCSLLVALWCVILFSRFSVESGWPLARSAMIVAILALLAQGYEVYLSSTNTQWLCALSLLFICVGQRRTSRGLSRALLYAWVAVCAFSGVPSSVMTPMFLVRGTVFRSTLHFRLGLVLAAGTAIQAIVIVLYPHADRSFSPTMLLMTAPWLLQTVASPLFTAEGAEFLVAFLKWPQNPYAVALVYIVLSSIAAFALAAGYREAKDKTVAVVLAMVWILIPSIQIFGVMGDPNELLSGWKHGRYFFIGAVCFVMLLGIVADKTSPIVRLTTSSLLLMALCASIHQIDHGNCKRPCYTVHRGAARLPRAMVAAHAWSSHGPSVPNGRSYSATDEPKKEHRTTDRPVGHVECAAQGEAQEPRTLLLTGLFEPALILTMGGVAGFHVLAGAAQVRTRTVFEMCSRDRFTSSPRACCQRFNRCYSNRTPYRSRFYG